MFLQRLVYLANLRIDLLNMLEQVYQQLTVS